MVRAALRLAPFVVASLLAGPVPSKAVDVQVVAPSTPGSSWDQVAQAIKAAAAFIPARPNVEVINRPGAGGTVGLTEFAASSGADAMLVTGSIMLDAALAYRTPITLHQLTPIARLATEPFVVVVPADSPLKSIGDLRSELDNDAARVSWAGGPVGGIDHVATILLSGAFGIPPTRLNYAPFLTSAEAATAVAERRVAIAVLSVGEVSAELEAGRMRVLAVGAESRLEGIDAPSLRESGLPLDLVNWRGLVARQGLSREAQMRLAELAVAVFGTPEWSGLVARKRWSNAFMGPEAFDTFLKQEHAQAKAALKAVGLLKGPGE